MRSLDSAIASPGIAWKMSSKTDIYQFQKKVHISSNFSPKIADNNKGETIRGNLMGGGKTVGKKHDTRWIAEVLGRVGERNTEAQL